MPAVHVICSKESCVFSLLELVVTSSAAIHDCRQRDKEA